MWKLRSVAIFANQKLRALQGVVGSAIAGMGSGGTHSNYHGLYITRLEKINKKKLPGSPRDSGSVISERQEHGTRRAFAEWTDFGGALVRLEEKTRFGNAWLRHLGGAELSLSRSGNCHSATPFPSP